MTSGRLLLLALLALALLALGAGACGQGHPGDRPARASATAAVAAGGAAGAHGTSGGAGALMADQDRDSATRGYYDGDDGEIGSYGRAATPAERNAIAALVKRYYAAASSQDADRACALTYYLDAETFSERYGEPPGPRWLQGAGSCRAVLARVFSHFHVKLTEPVVVTAVRVEGKRADALVGFRALPAGYVKLRREGRAWRIDGLLAEPLP